MDNKPSRYHFCVILYFSFTSCSIDILPANQFWHFPAATAQYQHMVITLHSRQLLKIGTWLPKTSWATCKGEIKDNTKVTSSWFLIHTELRCTVNHTSDLPYNIHRWDPPLTTLGATHTATLRKNQPTRPAHNLVLHDSPTALMISHMQTVV